MKKGHSILLILSLLFSVGIIIAITLAEIQENGHEANEVFIFINGNEIDLQNAIDNGNFSSKFTGTGSYSQNIIHGHKGDEILINLDGTIKTLQQAINDSSLCNFEGGTSSSFGTITGKKQTGDEIWIVNKSGNGKALQEAINDGEFYKCSPELINIALPENGGVSNCPELNNNNFDDGCGPYGRDYGGSVSYTGTLDVSSLNSISNITYKTEIYASASCSFNADTSSVRKLSIKQNGIWTEIDSCGSGGDSSSCSGTFGLDDGWTDIEEIKVYGYAYLEWNWDGCREGRFVARINEIQAWGTQ